MPQKLIRTVNNRGFPVDASPASGGPAAAAGAAAAGPAAAAAQQQQPAARPQLPPAQAGPLYSSLMGVAAGATAASMANTPGSE